MEWKFSQLDEDRDGVLKKQELKTFRESIQKVNLAEVAHSLGIFSINRSWGNILGVFSDTGML